MWPFSTKPKPKAQRSRITGETCSMLLQALFRGRTLPNFKLFMQKQTLTCPTTADVEQASQRAFMPWCQDVWECEDIARAFVHECQRTAANEGCSWAVGTLRANSPLGTPNEMHVFAWCIVEDSHGARAAKIYDPTACQWCNIPSGIDYALS